MRNTSLSTHALLALMAAPAMAQSVQSPSCYNAGYSQLDRPDGDPARSPADSVRSSRISALKAEVSVGVRDDEFGTSPVSP
jgi:hypothetical protein